MSRRSLFEILHTDHVEIYTELICEIDYSHSLVPKINSGLT